MTKDSNFFDAIKNIPTQKSEFITPIFEFTENLKKQAIVFHFDSRDTKNYVTKPLCEGGIIEIKTKEVVDTTFLKLIKVSSCLGRTSFDFQDGVSFEVNSLVYDEATETFYAAANRKVYIVNVQKIGVIEHRLNTAPYLRWQAMAQIGNCLVPFEGLNKNDSK